MKIEMHFHTKETSPCGKVPARLGVQAMKNAGYEGIVITDHFSQEIFDKYEKWDQVLEEFLRGYRAALVAGSQLGIRIYLGMEIRFPENLNDFLVYGVTEEFLRENPWSYRLNLETFSKLAQKWGLFLVQAHPFRDGCFPESPEYLQGAEVFNANPRHNSNNSRSLEWAREHHLVETVGSDYHRDGDLYEKGFELLQLPKDEKGLAQALWNLRAQVS